MIDVVVQTLKAADLSPADVAALVELRLRMQVRVDHAGKHAESLARLAGAGVVQFDLAFCTLTEDELTAELRALGFKGGGGTGSKGQQYTWAPYWMWNPAAHAIELLREIERRPKAELDWETFSNWVLERWSYNDGPTILAASERFSIPVLDLVDIVDRYYWAYRVPHQDVPIERHTIELEGE